MSLKTLTFEITIQAPVEKVWNTMLQKDTYEQWTTEFSEGSTYEGSWEEGSDMRFLGPDGGGMIAQIVESREYEFISIKHLGMIEGDSPEYEMPKEWEPGFENYTFEAAGDATRLLIHQDIMPEYEEMFLEMWPRALEKLKTLCERE